MRQRQAVELAVELMGLQQGGMKALEVAMINRWLLVLTALCIIPCGYQVSDYTQRIGARVRPRDKVSTNSSPGRADRAVQHWTPETGAHYPNLPHQVEFKGIGKKVSLLPEARSRKEIVGWADEYQLRRVLEVYSVNPSASWFIVTDIFTSGVQAWMVYLYVHCPLQTGDPRPWKLVFVGSQGLVTQHLNDIECAYVDTQARSLVFAERTGKKIKAISIDAELRMLRGREQEE